MVTCPPVRVQNMEVKMVDIRQRLWVCDVLDLAGRAPLDLPDRCWGAGNQDHENTSHLRMLGEILPRQFVLPGSRRAEHDGNASAFGESANPATETTSHAHQVSVVQGLVAAVQQPPPSAKPSRLLPQREVSVENDTVHTVILTFKKIGVLIAKSVAHGWRIIRQHLVIQLPRQGPLFLSGVSEKA